MKSKSQEVLGVAARTVVAMFLAGCAGLASAEDYCCKCKGQSAGKTISGASGPLDAAARCGRDCGSVTAPTPGKCAEAAPAAAPASAAPAARAAASSAASDFVSVAPGAKVLANDGRIRVIDFQPSAGTKVPMHAHPTTVVYLLKGGTTRFTLEDGRTGKTQFTLLDGSMPKPADLKDGMALINPAVTHSQVHLQDVRALIVELKR